MGAPSRRSTLLRSSNGANGHAVTTWRTGAVHAATAPVAAGTGPRKRQRKQQIGTLRVIHHDSWSALTCRDVRDPADVGVVHRDAPRVVSMTVIHGGRRAAGAGASCHVGGGRPFPLGRNSACAVGSNDGCRAGGGRGEPGRNRLSGGDAPRLLRRLPMRAQCSPWERRRRVTRRRGMQREATASGGGLCWGPPR